MAGRSMTESQVRRFVSSMEEQGVGVTRTKKGLFLRLPDGQSTTVHFTNSDVRAHDNLIARLRRAGVRHPEDPKNVAQLPAQITAGNVAPSSKRKVLAAMADLGYPDTVRVVQIAEATGMEHVTTSRSLFHMGFTPVIGKRNARDWITPEEILALKPIEDPEPDGDVPAEFEAEQDQPESSTLPVAEHGQTPFTDQALMEYADRARAAQEVVNSMGMGTNVSRETSVVVTRDGDREFIDSYDSWVIPMETVLGNTYYMHRDTLNLIHALGLEYEFRVWRKA